MLAPPTVSAAAPLPPPPPLPAAASDRCAHARPCQCLALQGCSHALKLRHSFKLDAKTRMEIGLDLDVSLSSASVAPPLT